MWEMVKAHGLRDDDGARMHHNMFLSGARHKKIFRLVSRVDQKKALAKAAADQSTPEFLITPYSRPHELKTIFKVDYADAFKALSVRYFQKRYVWKDEEGRVFDTSGKKDIQVTFPMLAPVAVQFKIHPKLVDPEPVWDYIPTNIPGIPVIAILGHANHGKTTLLDALSQSNFTETEAGHITQNIRAHTTTVYTPTDPELPDPQISSLECYPLQGHFPSLSGAEYDLARINAKVKARGKLSSPSNISDPELPRYTFIDTPGQGIFDIMRGRAASLADATMIVVDITDISGSQTREALIRASQNDRPLMVVLTKADLPLVNPGLAKKRLHKVATDMLDEGLVSQRVVDSCLRAVAVSALKGEGLDDLARELKRMVALHVDLHDVRVAHLSTTPHMMPPALVLSRDKTEPHAVIPGQASWYPPEVRDSFRRQTLSNLSANWAGVELIRRRLEALQDYEKNRPTGVGIVVDTQMQHDSRGRTVHVVMRQGCLVQGQYFLAGTHYGRARQVWSSDSGYVDEAVAVGPGMAVQVQGLDFEGEVAPDDLFLVLPQLQAWRLAVYRRGVEKLRTLQSSGPIMHVAWESDAPQINSRTNVDGMYDKRDREEKVQDDTDGRARIQEWGGASGSSGAKFEHTTTGDFERTLTGRKRLGPDSSVIQSDSESDSEEDEEEVLVEGGRKTKPSVFAGHGEDETDFTLDSMISTRNGKRVANGDNDSDSSTSSSDEEGDEEEPEVEFHMRKRRLTPPSSSPMEDNNDDDDDTPANRGGRRRTPRARRGSATSTSEDEMKPSIPHPSRWPAEDEVKGLDPDQRLVFDSALDGIFDEHGNTIKQPKGSSKKLSPKPTSTTTTTPESNDDSDEEEEEEDNSRWAGYADLQEQPDLKALRTTIDAQAKKDDRTANIERYYAEERLRKAQLVVDAEKVRRAALRMPLLSPAEEDSLLQVALAENDRKERKLPMPTKFDDLESADTRPLPAAGSPVVPVILRTAFQQSYGVLVDAIEDLQRETGCRLPIVYGGVGAVRPTDVTHAVVEQHYGYCPVYAFQVPTLPQAKQLAETHEIKVRTCNVYTEVLDDLRKRCAKVMELREGRQRTQDYRVAPTKSGV